MNLPARQTAEKQTSSQSPQPASAVVVCGALAVLSAYAAAMAFHVRCCFVDDAFTGFQYINNLLAGNGFVFFPGDAPVEGVTNIGWLLLLAPFCTIAAPTVVAKLIGLALVLLTLGLTARLGWGLAAKFAPPENAFGLALFPVLMLAASFEFMYFSLAGMETSLLAAILTLMACIALWRPQSLLLPLLGALSFLVHPEAVMVYPLYAALGWRRAGRGPVFAVLLFVALLGGATAIRLAYFHDFLPNTFHSKPSGLGVAVPNGYDFLMGRNTNVAFPLTGWLAVPVLLLGYLRLRRAAPSAADMLAAICTAGLALAIYSPPDWTALPRYFAPYLPAALILLWAGLLEAIGRLLPGGIRPTSRAITALAALLLLLTSVSDGLAKLAQMEEFPGYIMAGKNLVAPSLWMRDHLPDGATIASRRIGALAYYSQRKVFDYAYGLTDAEVARLVARHGRRFDTPTDPLLAAVWRARAPDCLLEDEAMMDYIVSQAGGRRQRFSIHGIEYRVVEQFPVGRQAQWVLAQRIAAE